MQARIGQSFEGVISSLTAWGIYVELENTIEGMIHISNLHDDYYVYFEEKQEIIGERTHKSYKLGQKVQIVVTDADKMTRTIDFELA